VSEERKVDGVHLDLSLTENVHLPSRKGMVVADAKEHQAADDWLKRLSTKYASTHSRVRDLSGGNQQKVAFARLLYADCDVFLLDEPTRGIDIGSKTDLYREIDRVANEGKTVVMAGSYLPELLGICDRIAVLSRGSLVSVQRASEATPESILRDCLA
jgi:ribose transport system ATP-binding protein